ncbi:hypothetical protein FLPS103535_12580 [Flavobacterium psychrophilum]
MAIPQEIAGVFIGFTLTFIVAVFIISVIPSQAFTVQVTVYAPESVSIAFVFVGFCNVLVKLLGPVQAKVVPVGKGLVTVPVTLRFIVPPRHTFCGVTTCGSSTIAGTTAIVAVRVIVQPKELITSV